MQIGLARLCLTGLGGGAGVTYSPEAVAAFAAMSTQPTAPLRALYDACIVSLKTAGIWAKLDALYLMGVETAQAARVNIKNPGMFDLTAVSGPTFTAKQGYTGDGSAMYLDTNFNPSTATTPNWAQNSASLFVWPRTATGLAGNQAGSFTGNTTSLNTRNATDSATSRMNNATLTSIANTDGANLMANDRSGGAGYDVYKAGSAFGTSAQASSAVANDKFSLLTGGGAFSAKQLSVAGFGATLSAGQHTSLYTALNTFKTGAEAL